MKKMIQRLIAVLLCTCMIGSMLPVQAADTETVALAAPQTVAQGEQPASLDTPDGEIPVEEDWNETYPFGTFAFGTHQADVGEPGAKTKDGEAIPQTILIPVYRLGGTVGRVTARITYAPAITTQADGTGSLYDYAASGRQDLLIEYENPNPIAAYQDLGVPLAQRKMTAAEASIVVPEAPEDAKREDELKLTVSASAETYRWQVRQFGTWQDVRDANEPELTLTWGDLWNFDAGTWSGLDFRCILGTGGVLTCTASLMGEVYEPISETPALPEDLDTEAEPGYAELIFESDYDVYQFELTFADGETVKYIRVTARDDELSELPELGLFTIAACEGGELSDMCNTLTLMVSDNDKAEPSEIGFSGTGITASRADQTARVKVARTGGKSYNVTVHYETVDGTAKAGVDYAKKEGELAFAGSIDEIEIPIELIATDDTSEKTFDLILTELRGGGEEELCRLSSERVTVTITGKSPEKAADGSGQNLASLLSGGNGEDVSAQVQQGENALIGSGNAAAVTGHSDLPEPEELKATIYTPEPNRMHVLYPHFTFSRGTTDAEIAAYKENYWQDWERILGDNYETDTSTLMNYSDRFSFDLKETHPNAAVARHIQSDFTYTSAFGITVTQKVDALLANYDATGHVDIPNVGKYFGALVFATRLNAVGIKNRHNGNLYLRPDLAFYCQYSSQSAWFEMDNNWEFGNGRDKHRYYWFTDGGNWVDNPEDGATSYGADPGVDSWRGKGDVGPAPIPWDISNTGMNVYFRMLKQWGDTVVDQNEVCQNGETTDLYILYYSLGRREFMTTRYNVYPNQIDGNGIPIVVYTANDSNTAGIYTPITDYSFIQPEISIVAKEGGVSTSGNIYVGSKLRIKFNLNNMAGFSVAQNGLFLTNSSGTRVATASQTSGGSGEYILEMLWDGMNDASLWDTYQLNIILERAQSFEIDISPSAPLEEDGSYNYVKAWNDFMGRNPAPEVFSSSLTYSEGNPVLLIPTEGGAADYYLPYAESTTLASGSFTPSGGKYTLNAANAVKNVQAVNFHQDADDVILYNGRAYAGNETIPITVADMTHKTLQFIFYDSDYLEAVSPMEVSIDRVEVYYDKNGNGKIDGSVKLSDLDTFVLDTETVPDPDHPGQTITRTKDDFISIVEGEYPDTYFKPYLDKDGIVVHQYFFKVFLQIRPRSMVVPAGADPDGKAQLLPVFFSAITDPEEAAKLTEEQKSPRYILGYNTDGHDMYGAEANKMTFIDIPLGGDTGEKSYKTETIYTWNDGTEMIPPDDDTLYVIPSSPDDMTKIVDSDTVTVYRWKPDYTGQLLVPFKNPTPIVDTDNITGGAVAIAGESPSMNADGTYSYSDNGRNQVNANLASFCGRTTFSIGIQEQVKPTQSTRSQTGIDSLNDIKPETLQEGGVSCTPGPESLLNLSSGGDPGDTSGTGPGDDVGAKEFAPDLGTQLPSLELELGDYVTVIMDGYEVGFAIGIPVYQYEDTNYSGSEQTTENKTDGSVTTTRKDDKGNTIQETVKEDNGVKTKSTTTIPADPDGAGAKRCETITVTTDKDGKETTKKTIELRYKQDWNDPKEKEAVIYSRTEDVKPPTEPTKSEKASEGFKSANGGMATLKEFCKALTSPKKGSMKQFFDGAFDDESLDNAKNGNTTAQKVSVTFKIQISIMFEFNPIDNGYYFKTAGLAGTLGFEFTIQHRFSFCPLIYVYLKIGIEVEVKVSLSVLRKAKEGDAITTFENQRTLADLSQGKSVTFALDMRKKPVDPESGLQSDAKTARGFHLDLKGKVFMEVAEENNGIRKTLTSGLLTGDGSTKEVLFEAYNKIVYITLTPKKTSQVTAANLKPVIGATSKTVFDGLTITPGLSLEVGAGIGVELLKFEIFIRTSVAISMTMGGYLEETDKYEGFYISSFEWSLALGFHVTVAFFNYSMDCIAIGVEGAQHGTGGYFNWDITASAVDGNVTLWEKHTYTAADGKSLGTDEPEPPDGFNIFKDNNTCAFFNADGTVTDISDKPSGTQDWSFSEHVSAFRWTGGKFKGEVPQNGDLAVSRAEGAKVHFTTTEDEIWIFFSGTVKITADDYGPTEVFKKSPAKLKFKNSGTHSVDIVANKGAKLDRYETPPTGDDGNSAGDTTLHAKAKAQSLVHVSAPTDISGTQKVYKPVEDTRAIDPTGTDDFQLSGYNTSGDARKLVDGLAVGYDYKLLQAGDENYVIYPLMVGENPQLVMSKLVMTGNLAGNTGLVHPLDKNNGTPYLLLDNDGLSDDGLTDLDYSAVAGTDSIRVTWVSHADADGQTYTVRTRTINLTEGATNAAPTSTDTSEDYRYLPASAGNTDLWVAADGSGEDNNALYKAWLLARNPGITEADLVNHTTADPNSAAAVFNWAMTSALNDLYGSGSILRSSNGAEEEIPGEAVENLEAVQLGDRTLVLYSTTQTAYFNKTDDGFVTVGAGHLDEITADTERGIIRRLYLRSLDDTGFGTAKLLQTAIDFDSCAEDNLASAGLKDGFYENSALRTAQADPYFSNFRFLKADLGDSGDEDDADAESAETFALFEFGGNTWLLKQDDLETVLDGTGAVTMIPVFSEATGTDVCIGSDGDNMAVVYTAPVADSLSNAIFVAWWDKNLNDEQGGWGTPTILAMRDLQVYEDRITYDMSGEDAEQAYLGDLVTPTGYTGSMNRMTFSNLQMSTRSAENKQQLIIMTQGSLTKLKEQIFERGEGKEDYVAIVPDGDATTAFYAIAFGAGEQALGEARLGLSEYDFTLGSRLIGQVEFTNTGTVAVRASNDNPMTVRLMARVPGSNPEELAVWNLTTSIASGARTKLTFRALPLTMNLPADTVLYLEVAEDSSYFTEPFYAILDNLLIVDDIPELSLNDFNMNFLQVREAPDGTMVADYRLELSVANNGSKKAEDLFLQFSYDTGEKDEFGNEICYPIDISGSSLTTASQKAIDTRDVSPMKLGIYKMIDSSSSGSGSDDLDVGYYRKVEGTLVVPASCFASRENFSGLHLRVEVYSACDTPDVYYDVYSSDHKEYNSANNSVEQTFKHQTTFDVPARITTALGTTLTLPVSFASTGKTPELVLTEVSDGTDGWEPRMGICYYDPARGVIVAAPNAKAQALLEAGQKPTGILQIKDQSTNTIAAIAYTIGAMADGVNIYRDDASFRFCDKNGNPVNLNAAASDHPAWLFLDKSVELGWEGGKIGEIPMNRDLSMCNQDGAYFTFETVADSIVLYYMGEVTVTSDVFDVEAEPVYTDRQFPVKYKFTKNNQGNNTGMKHTVKITAKLGTRIDRYVADYKTNTVPDTDPDAPQILWNRSFPDPASVQPGAGVPMTCWILDASGLQTVTFNGQALSGTTNPKLVQVDENLWYFDYTFTENGPNSVRALDVSGNIGTGSFGVDWFNDVLSIGAVSTAPGLARNHLSFVDANGNPVPATGTLTTAPFLKSAYVPASGEQSSAYLFANGAFPDDPLGRAVNERWLASWNGYYLVRVDRDDGTWARTITVLKNLDLTPPAVTPGLSGKGTPDAPYLIGSRPDWQKMMNYVNGGNPCAGMCFLQTADIAITEADMVGTNTCTFQGVYDGGGHTLTINANVTATDCAPFLWAENAAFRNLRVDGIIITTDKFAAGILVTAVGSCSFTNCRSSIIIQSNRSGDGSHGGLVGYGKTGSTLYVIGCVVDGSFLGSGTTLCSGFMGYTEGSITIQDSLFAPRDWEWGNSQNFYRNRNNAGERILLNSYYLETNANTQGSRGYAVRGGEDVVLEFSGGTVYDVAGLRALSTGLYYQDALRAAANETVSFTPRYSGSDPDNAEDFFAASAGELVSTKGAYVLSMPAEDVTISIGDHLWGKPEYVWETDNSKITAFVRCAHNSNHVQAETVTPNFVLTKPSTFEEEGAGYYIATFSDGRFETQIKYVVVPPVACEGGDACPSKHFTDMPAITSTMHIPIDWAVLNKITTGTSPTTFGPKNSCTRAQFVTFLWRTCGQPEPTVTEHPFKDVKATAFYYKAMLWAVENNITSGTSETTFSPNKPCTRAQVVTFIWRLENTPEPTTTDNPFVDVKPKAYYYKAVLWAVERGITTGTSATTFGPGKDCTRGQCVTFLYREFAQ